MIKYFITSKTVKKIVIIILIIAVMVGLFLLFKGNNVLSRRAVSALQKTILSYGALAPLIVIVMIILSTIIPPLPLPVPLVELAAGVIFGFWKGWLIIWLGQIVSSLAAFGTVRLFKKTIFGRWLEQRQWGFYLNYLKRTGAKAIVITRATMSAPFNIISFLASLTSISWTSFLAATAIGVIPETVLYALIGSQLRKIHIHFIWLSIIVLAISLIGFGISLIMATIMKPKIAGEKNQNT
jgi:uncharacterized membrane protein YdjX (TVP38/TMEM64 family)